jgi:hypothetical protein
MHVDDIESIDFLCWRIRIVSDYRLEILNSSWSCENLVFCNR